ncbi:hypothetical protein ABF162_09740 [Vibrio coralliilyticus]|uniref:hypothetical protein n=1 Tax=Vibrio coralliilyticus TaxID=190893 RepID=UPI00051296F2|nr:hypothetical protein [Vibrio coralliilyticus]AIU67247.1 hypothetical protein JV59_33695 [Vibrio coralliilyticus]
MLFENDPKIGTLGEQVFSTWCTTAHLTSNRSLEEDRTGWDHQIEFPYLETALPRDKQQSPIQCRIQVKSTQRKDRKWAIKVSVLKRLIDYSYPSFFLFLEFTADEEPTVENAFLVHIDNKIIERTLKKIRKNDTQKKPKELHELKLSISYSKKRNLISASGKSFRNAVVDFIPEGNIAEYQKNKIDAVNEIGYGKEGYKMEFRISPENLNRHIVAQSLGLNEGPALVKNSVLFDNRFNLESGPVELKRANQAELIIKPNIVDTCQIRFKESEFSPSINFDGQFISSVDAFSLGKKNKLFLKASLFSFELIDLSDLSDIKARLHFTLERAVPLDDVIKMFKLFHDDNVGKKLICEVKLHDEKRTLNFHVGMDYDLQDARTVADSLSVLKDSFNIDGKTLVTPDEVFQQRTVLAALVGTIQNKVDGFIVKFEDDVEEYPEEIQAPEIIGAKIGMLYIGVIVLFHGSRQKDNSYQVIKSDVLRPLLFTEGKPTKETLERIKQEALDVALENTN